MRQETLGIEAEASRLEAAWEEVADVPALAGRTQDAVTAAATELEVARQVCARVTAQHDHAREADARRAQLLAEREAAQTAARSAMQALADRSSGRACGSERLARRAAQRLAQVGPEQAASGGRAGAMQCLAGQRASGATRGSAPAAGRTPSGAARAERVRLARIQLADRKQARGQLRMLAQRVQGIERAGRRPRRRRHCRRFGLTAEVLCSGMPLQGRCQLHAGRP